MAEIDYSKGKIPGAESGIEIRHSVCDICTPGMHCGLDVYVKDKTEAYGSPRSVK